MCCLLFVFRRLKIGDARNASKEICALKQKNPPAGKFLAVGRESLATFLKVA
jgi:hypothetical protein